MRFALIAAAVSVALPAFANDDIVLRGMAGGKVDWINLPEIGIRGNSHMLMQDKNSDQIAEVIQKWLVSQNLAD